MQFEEWLSQRYINFFIKSVNDSDRSGIHVTDIVSPCLRKAWYTMKFKELRLVRELTVAQAYIFWIGKKYHEIPISNVAINGKTIHIVPDLDSVKIVFNEELGRFEVYDNNDIFIGVYGHEFPVSWYGVRGQIDEIVSFDGKIYIVDKKTTKMIPPKPYPDYIKQVEYYSVLLRHQNGIDADYGAILYIQKASEGTQPLRTKAFVWELSNIDEVEKEFVEKVDLLKEYLEKDELPRANPVPHACKFCQWKSLCMKNERDVTLVLKRQQQNLFEFMKKR